MKDILLELITPEGILVKENVKRVFAPTENGEIGIYDSHASLKSKLKAGSLRYYISEDNMEIYACLGGVIEVQNNKVVVLTDFAQKAEDIDVVEAAKEEKRALALVQTLSKTANSSDPQLLLAELELRKQVAKLEASRLKKNMLV